MEEYFCTHCGANLEAQYGFDPDGKRWTCEVCGELLLNPDEDDSDCRFEDVTWYCDRCGACLNDQFGFSDWHDEWECTECGYRNSIDEDHIGEHDDDDDDEDDNVDDDDDYDDGDRDDYFVSNSPQDLKRKTGFTMSRQMKWLIVVLVALVIVLAAYWGIHKYREGKVRIPFESSYAIGKKLDTIVNELEKAGFKRIIRKEDFSGWLDDESVMSVIVDGRGDFKKGKYLNPNVSVVITYSSENRIDVTSLLQDWETKKVSQIKAILEAAGFSNVEMKEVVTTERAKEDEVVSITLNGQKYNNETCYIPFNAPILVSYFTYRIALGGSNQDFVGQELADVLKSFENRGFTNIRTEEYEQGWAKGNTVVSVYVENHIDYARDKVFKPDVDVRILYSSNNREDITNAVESWKSMNVESMTKMLESAGLDNYEFHEKNGEDITIEDYQIVGMNINNELYIKGGCYIPENASINIDFYRVKIHIGTRLGDYDKDKKMKYKSVVENLQKLGFTNIKLYRNNDLTTGWIDSEGSIASFYIDGKAYNKDGDRKADVSKAEPFYRDVLIEVVVNTFKKDSCPEITEYKKY